VRISAIDGLRAIAMTMVVGHHCHVLPAGWTGVWLFFVVSGYVITRGFLRNPLERQHEGSIAEQCRAFWARRFVRIVPVYLLYVAVNVIVLLCIGQAQRLRELSYLLSFTYNWYLIDVMKPDYDDWGPFSPLWSLSVEQQFYLLFPILALWIAPRLRLRLTLALVCLGPFVRLALSTWAQGAFDSDIARGFCLYAASISHIDAFLLGSLLARLEPHLERTGYTRTASNSLWVAALGSLVAYGVGYFGVNRGLGMSNWDDLRNLASGPFYGQSREVFLYVVLDLLSAAVLLHVASGRALSGVLSARWPVLIGRISYGAYLFHALVLWGLTEGVGLDKDGLSLGERLGLFGVVWGVTQLLAYVSFEWFETPLDDYFRRRRKQREKRLSRDRMSLSAVG